MVAINAMIEAAMNAQEPTWKLTPWQARERHDAQGGAPRQRLSRGENRVVTTATGSHPVRIFVPSTVRSVCLYIHGGAWMMGGIDFADDLLAARADRADSVVISLSYRLAPEHPWPAALDDCVAAAQWLIDYADRRFSTSRLLISGDSAGAHLAVSTLLSLRDNFALTPFCGADLRYGMYDLRLTPSARLYKGPALDAPTLRWVLDHAFGPAAARDSPQVSPLLADLTGMPPALFTVGTRDSLLDDTLFMWARWRAAGSPAELSLHPGGMHAFDYTDTADAQAALDRSVSFMQGCTT